MSKPATTAAPWSYSKLHSFETCSKQFHHVKVLAQYPERETDAMRYGTELHKAAELYVRDNVPLPVEFTFMRRTLDALKRRGDMRLCEYRMGLTAELEPCGFFSNNVWWRGVVDLLILDSDKGYARVVDYKSGNDKYADKGQLELMALAVFKHFPVVTTIDAALLFAVKNRFIKDRYTLNDVPKLWKKWIGKFGQMDSAYDNDVWNPVPSGLCHRHCPVLECSHNGRN